MISILIVNYNNEDFLLNCLRSIQKFPPTEAYEVLVVDNNSPGEKFNKIAANFSDQKNYSFIRSRENLGFGKANNLAASRSKGEWIFILNPDIEVKKNTFDILIDFAKKRSNVGAVGPKLVYPDGKVQDSFRRFPRIIDLVIKRIPFLRKIFHRRMVHFLMWGKKLEEAFAVDWVVGAFILIRKDLWIKLDGFDPRFFLFFEDTDLCRRIIERGYEVYLNPHAKATHNHKRLSDTERLRDFISKKTFLIHLASAIKYFLKWGLR